MLQKSLSTPEASRRYGRFVLLCFVVFFGLIFVANIFLVSTALKTHKGVVSENAYQEGLDYNKTIAAYEQQKLLGWHITPSVRKDLLAITVKNAQNKPITKAQVRAFVTRGDQKQFDQKITLSEKTQGIYQTDFQFAAKGKWTIYFLIKDHMNSYQYHHIFIME